MSRTYMPNLRQNGSPQNLFKQAFAPSIATCQPCHPSHCCLLTGNLANVHWLPPFQHCFSLATSLLLSTSHSALPGLGTRSPGHAKAPIRSHKPDSGLIWMWYVCIHPWQVLAESDWLADHFLDQLNAWCCYHKKWHCIMLASMNPSTTYPTVNSVYIFIC